MAGARRDQTNVVVNNLTRQWLRGAEAELPAEERARIIAERALDAYETSRDPSKLTDAFAALHAADALGIPQLPALRERLEHLAKRPDAPRSAVTVLEASAGSASIDLPDLLRTLESYNYEPAYGLPDPAPEAAGGYPGEVTEALLVAGAVAIRDGLDPLLPLDTDPSLARYAQFASQARGRPSPDVMPPGSEVLDEAVESLENEVEAAIATPTWRQCLVHGDLALALLLRHRAGRQSDDLARAVAHADWAFRHAQEGDVGQQVVTWAGLLGAVLWTRFEAEGDSDDLEIAAHLLSQTADPEDPAEVPRTSRSARLEWLRLVGAVQRYSYAVSGLPQDLDRAARLHRALEEEPFFTNGAVRHASLGYTWLSASGDADPAALEKAIAALKLAVVEGDSCESAARRAWAATLVTALEARFTRGGDLDSLEQVVQAAADALADTPEGLPEHPVLLGALGRALLWRHFLTGAHSDLRTAHTLLKASGDRTSLAAVLHAEYRWASDLRALDSAVDMAASELRATVDARGAHLPAAFDLAQYLLSRAEVLRAPEDAAAAARLLGHCLEWTGQAGEEQPLLHVEYNRAQVVRSEAAMAAGSSAVPDESGSSLPEAASALMDIVNGSGADGELVAEAEELLARTIAAARPNRRPTRRPSANTPPPLVDDEVLWEAQALLEARAAAAGRPSRWPAPREVPRSTEATLNEVRRRVDAAVTRYPTANATEQARYAVREAEALALQCLEADAPRAAFDALEAGRAVVTDAAAVEPFAIESSGAGSFRVNRTRQLPGREEAPFGAHRPSLPRTAAAGGGQAGQPGHRGMPNAVRELQELPTPEETAAACRALGVDAVVHLLAGPEAGSALIVHQDSRLVTLPLPLLSLREPALTGFAGEHDRLLRSGEDLSRAWPRVLQRVCDWAWTAAVKQLSTYLAAFSPGRTPRVVFIPYGTLALVPWHAARERVAGRGGGFRFAIESLAISYASSAHALCRFSRRSLAPLTGEGLVVVDPTGDLPHARQEGEDVHRWHYPKGQRLGSSRAAGGPPATPRAVLAAMGGQAPCPVAHFACHAENRAPATDSYLRLAGGQRLSVARLLERRPGGEGETRVEPLVVLSACATAIPSAHYDSALSLAAAFAAAGAAAVVGTLWPVDDAAAAALMRDFHALLNLDGLPPAEALRAAQLRALREARAKSLGRNGRGAAPAGDPSPWAAFVHQGLGHPDAPARESVGSTIAGLPPSAGDAASSVSPVRLPVFPSLPGPDPTTFIWTCPVADCPEQAPGDMDSPFDADRCTVHPDDALVLK
ncbi:CHAT domain-containing protein [Streptomyces sp. NBC_01477]|uniref:CHAT domain-containing protein n=1 Tax=Streptomyces sp. NBC_01477 TaxID=2976015 RepID=UPI002E315A14|nr:CHAT domain-containing protein [Streptomyces sp. NBC_01477]